MQAGLSHQSKPSYKPSPRVATAACTCHFRPFSCDMPSASQTSAGDRAPPCTHGARVGMPLGHDAQAFARLGGFCQALSQPVRVGTPLAHGAQAFTRMRDFC